MSMKSKMSVGTVVLIIALLVSISVNCALAEIISAMNRGQRLADSVGGAFKDASGLFGVLLVVVTVVVVLLTTDFDRNRPSSS